MSLSCLGGTDHWKSLSSRNRGRREKKCRKWLGAWNWGRQLGERQWAEIRDILETMARGREAQRRVVTCTTTAGSCWAHFSPAGDGRLQGCGSGQGLVAQTQEHPRGNYPWPVHLSLDLRGSLTEECHAGLLPTSSSPSAASFYTLLVAGRITAPKGVHALIPWDL